MDAKHYWLQVSEESAKLKQSLAEGIEGQPALSEQFVYLVSRGTRYNNMVSGSVCPVELKLAAQRIVDETHELASAEQIAGYLQRQQDEASAIKAANLARKAQVVMHVNEKMEPLEDGATEQTPGRASRKASK